ncbi:hypothetical protein Vretimale_4311 [Volvox reticuliferus]|nr:hypothetical protein Vretifemale_2901 [Volvox reticuliferus]GIL99059.1 hypothetical protein Vretimale_4311 [Volvox reticuliferus]
MVTLQPAFLACHTATIRSRAQRLAFVLSIGNTSPARDSGYEVTSGAASLARGIPSKAGQGGHAPPAISTTEKRANTVPVGAACPQLLRHLAVDTLAVAPSSNDNTSATGRDAGPAAQKDASITTQAALELIARQPALLEMPMDRLVTRCTDLAEMLDVAPYDTCHCLTRMRSEELARMLQASQLVIQESWLGLVTAVASLQQPGLYGPFPSAPAIYNGHGVLEASAYTPFSRGPGRKLHDKGSSVNTASVSTQTENYKPPRPALRNDQRIDVLLPVSAERAAQRMVLLCPQLLMLPPGWVQASALHLRSLLGLTPAGLRRLMVRSPRLLLLPKRHREDALQALVDELALRQSEDAARLVSQQPNLLKWTPDGLRGKLAEMAGALGLSHRGVARLCRNQPALLAMSSQSLALKLQWLQRMLRLADADAARRLVLRQPGVLSMSSSTMERKVRLLAYGLGLTNVFVAAAPGPPGASTSVAQAAAATNITASATGGTSKYMSHTDTTSPTALAPAAPRGHRRIVLQTVLRLVVAEPTLLTMRVDAMPRRIEQLAEALNATTLHEARAMVLECPRLLLVQRAMLHYRLQELAWGLDAPPWAVKRLVRARPRAFFLPLQELREALARAEATGSGQGVHRRKMQVAAALKALAADDGELLDVGLDQDGAPNQLA